MSEDKDVSKKPAKVTAKNVEADYEVCEKIHNAAGDSKAED